MPRAKGKKVPRRRKRNRPDANATDRLQKRVSRVRPRPLPDESVEDRAIFDYGAFSKLPDELAEEVSAVREALAAVYSGRDEVAQQQLSKIPRRSKNSDWRLFIRGLIDWYRGDLTQAQQGWQRLDPARRPARIAATLMAAAERQTVEAANDLTDPDVRSGAKLVCRLRFERPALAEARTETARREPGPPDRPQADWLGPQKLQWLIDFRADHQRSEPELVEALSQAALARVFETPYVDMFELATQRLAGPPHDPQNFLLAYHYHERFKDGNENADRAIERFVESLPDNDRLPENVRAALASEVQLMLACGAIVPAGGGMFSRMMYGAEDRQLVDRHFRAATKAYPASPAAHREYVEWLQSHAENDQSRKSERVWYEKKLPGAMEAWSKGIPDETEPRLWLVDHYLEDEDTDAAAPHVQWLTASRHPDPRVRATEWKWQLLEAMRRCRRKAWLDHVEEHLNTAETIWPSWVSQSWLPYLRAAYALRRGDQQEHDRLRQLARDEVGRDSRYDLVDAAMALGAAQRMRIPAAELKAFREPIDQAVKRVSKLPGEQLLACGKFFLDLHRAGLLYPAYRMHGGKFAGELHQRLRTQASRFTQSKSEVGDEFWSAIYWLTQRQTFRENNQVRIPMVVRKHATPVQLAAVELHHHLANRYSIQISRMTESIELLQEAAATEPDPYLRHWYGVTAERANERIASERSIFAGFEDLIDSAFFGGGAWGGEEDGDGDDDDDWDDDDVLTDAYDPECDCPKCTMTRDRLGVPQPWETTDADDRAAKTAPPPDAEIRRKRPKNPMAKRRKNKQKKK